MRLAEVAPRLALARDQFLADQREHARREARRASVLLHKQRLVAHRELQLIRAFAKGKPGYILVRQRKLDQARKELARAEGL